MKSLTTTLTIIFISLFLMQTGKAQDSRDLQYFTAPDKTGLNEFEAPFTTDKEFDGLYVRIGGANTLQFQGLDHENSGAVPLEKIGTNFNLATSNLDLDVALENGLRMHLRSYLSSQHHTETYVKGGYLQIDRLDFISEGFASELMDHLRIKVGHMEINYGDNHFRRSDNGASILNPFVGNYIMDSFTTEVGAEVYIYGGDVFAMLGLTNTKLNQSVVKTDPKNKGSFVGKVGYDSQVNEDFRVRITGSIYTTGQAAGIYLYDGDRAGARYYNVLIPVDGSNFRSGRFAPGFNNEITAIMINPFIKYQGLELYGVIENVSGKNIGSKSRTFNQYAGEVLYRIGANENVYIGGRYNVVTGELASGENVTISRINIGGGWFLTNNVLTKIEYVNQQYKDFPAGDIYENGKFDGVMIEAVVSF